MLNKKSLGLFVFLSSFSLHAKAYENHYVTAPNCLLKSINAEYEILATKNDISLIKIKEQDIKSLISAKKIKQKSPCGGFMDITDSWNKNETIWKHNPDLCLSQYLIPVKPSGKFNYSIHYSKEVRQVYKQINTQLIWNDLTTLTNFHDRFANSENGVKATNWFKTQIEDMAKFHNRQDVNTFLIDTKHYRQSSVVVKIGQSNEPGVVIGAHLDTTSGMFSKKPGADDDGSGSITVFELARLLLSSGYQFKNPIYLVWYAAEEEGLFGSQQVVSYFKQKNIPVKAVLHFDMTGYAHKNEPTIWLMNDYVDTNLTSFLAILVTHYLKQPVNYTSCGYACSDHASWSQKGYIAAMPFEASFGNDNPYIHQKEDTIDKLSLIHMTDYLKLAIAFAVELAEPVSK